MFLVIEFTVISCYNDYHIVNLKMGVVINMETVTEAVTKITDQMSETSTTETNVVEAFTEKAEETVSIFTKISDLLSEKVPAIIFALVIIIVGIIATKIITALFSRVINKANVDKTAHGFLKSFIKSILYTIVVIVALTILGVPMTSIVAVVGAAGLALSLALQQCLSNVAGGFIILFAKPFKAGDVIEINGVSGVVENISILYTKIATFDNKLSYVPNGIISNEKIVNGTAKDTRRLDMEFSIGYDSDFRLAKSLVEEIIKKNKLAIQEPAPLVRMSSHGENSINIDVKVWTKTDNYFDLKYDMVEQVKDIFDQNNISIPYNILNVHMISEKENTKE